MRKNVFGRKFKRDHNERKALFKSLASELVLHDSIKTTEAKAKAVKPLVERLVTKARVGGLHAERQLRAHLVEPAVRRMIDEVAPRFVGRNGGYTRIIKMPNRLNDNARVAILEWVVQKANDKAEKPLAIASSTPVEEASIVEAEVVSDTSEKKPVKKAAVKKPAKKTTKKETK
jgi:large subunit ribosomal protein L17